MMEKLVQGDEAFGTVELIDRVIVDFDNDIGGFSNLENNDDKRKAKKIVSCSVIFSSPSSFHRMLWSVEKTCSPNLRHVCSSS